VAEKAHRHGLHVIIEDDGKPKSLEEDVLRVLYQSIHEALFNVLKHAGTEHARLWLRGRGPHIQVIVRDEGHGFNAPPISVHRRDGGFGLFNMREQLHQVDGTLKIVSAPAKGTTLIITVPEKPTLEPGQFLPSEVHYEGHVCDSRPGKGRF
jgi:signal transduction histidine kinase